MDDDVDVDGQYGRGDPRVRPDYVRTMSGRDDHERVVLVGVVHDHPASVHRTRAVVEDVAPDVLALELPSMAVALFERFADESTDRRSGGGEMSSAIRGARAAGTDRVVGIDVPSLAYGRALLEVLAETWPSFDAVRGVTAETLAITGRAVRCRVAAATGERPTTPWPVEPNVHSCRDDDPPDEQAAHEAAHLSRSRSLLGALEPPPSLQLADAARERAMARRVDALRRTGSVVAVVGFDHLDPVAETVDTLARA